MVRVKICGLQSAEDARLAEEAGADALGFVVEYPVPVPWNLSRQRAAALVAALRPFATPVAVVGGDPATLVAIARAVRPRVLQLHGDETPEQIRDVVRALGPEGIQVIKALRIEADTGLAVFAERDPVAAARAIADTGVAALVVDSKTSARPAGTGVPLDWEAVRAIAAAVRIPLILAGGLNPGNVANAIATVRPYGVDVISGVESASGVKDPAKVRAFVAAARGAA
jgi:phosphoribosylanthranilate isomerase